MMFVVQRRRVALMFVIVLLVMALLSLGAWRVLHAERAARDQSVSRISAEKDLLVSEITAVSEQREALSQRLVILERSAQVKSQAYAKVDSQLRELQRQILELKEDVAFYRGIVSGDPGGNRVHIQRLILEQEGDERDYRFRVVLTRGKQSDKVVDGVLLLSVDGNQDGEPVRLTLEELVTLPTAKLQFSFKHFQRLEGRIHLPERFVPKRVVIEVDIANSDTKPIRESFAWSVVNS